MSQLKLPVKHVGPERERGIPLPPVAELERANYVLAWEPGSRRVLYVHGGYGRFGATWAWDGARWAQVVKSGVRVGRELEDFHGFFDSTRGGVACWAVHEGAFRGVLVKDGKASRLRSSGDAPEHGAAGARAIFAFDEARRLTVCLTSRGVWEADARGRWTRRATFDKKFPEFLRSDHDGGFNPVARRVTFWTWSDSHELFVWEWDGEELRRIPNRGLPAGLYGFHEGVALTVHPKHGLLLHAGDRHGLFRVKADRSGWQPGPRARNPPPVTEQARGVYVPSLDAVLLGPGNYGRAWQHVFHVLRGDAWTRQGVFHQESPLEELSGRIFHAFFRGEWFAFGRYGRALVWRDEAWREVLSERAAARAFSGSKPNRGFGFAAVVNAADERLLIITEAGDVAAFDGRTLKQLGPRRAELTGREGMLFCFEPGRGRLVAWGGTVNGRKSNTTLFFEEGRWRPASHPSPAPRGLRAKAAGFVLFFDPVLGRVVRVDRREIATLEDEVWQTRAVKGFAGSLDRVREAFVAPRRGEVLLWDGSQLARFDLGRVSRLGEWRGPRNDDDTLMEYAFDPLRLELQVQDPGDLWARERLSLSSLFARAAKLGPRRRP
jgi:PAS domain-containing protein